MGTVTMLAQALKNFRSPAWSGAHLTTYDLIIEIIK